MVNQYFIKGFKLLKVILTISLSIIGTVIFANENADSSGDTTTENKNSRWYSATDVEQGRGLYAMYCLACHGHNAEGTKEWKRSDANGHFPPPPLNGSAHAWHHSRSLLRNYIRQGGSPWGGIMPPIDSKVSDTEINTIIAYFQSYWSDAIYSKWVQAQGVD